MRVGDEMVRGEDKGKDLGQSKGQSEGVGLGQIKDSNRVEEQGRVKIYEVQQKVKEGYSKVQGVYYSRINE